MEVVVKRGDREETVGLEELDPGYRVTLGERTYEVDVARVSPGHYSLILADRQVELAATHRGKGLFELVTSEGTEEVTVVDPLDHLARQAHGAAGGGPLRVDAYMPGRVVEILLEEGQAVEPGQGVLVLEAMKMKNEIQSEVAGRIREIFVQNGQAVEGGDPLFEIEPSEAD